MSTTPVPPGSHHGRRAVGRAGRPLLAAGAVLTAFVLAATPASAYWGAAGSGSATATTGTLAAPVGVTVPAQVVTDVPVSWSPGSPGATPDGYYVTRSDGETASPACGSTPTELVTDTVCVDFGVPAGDYTYAVTSVFRTWSSAGTASTTVVVLDPARSAFAARTSAPTGPTEQTGEPTASTSDVSSAPTEPVATPEPSPGPEPAPGAEPAPTPEPTPPAEPTPSPEPTPTADPSPTPTPTPTDTDLDGTATS